MCYLKGIFLYRRLEEGPQREKVGNNKAFQLFAQRCQLGSANGSANEAASEHLWVTLTIIAKS